MEVRKSLNHLSFCLVERFLSVYQLFLPSSTIRIMGERSSWNDREMSRRPRSRCSNTTNRWRSGQTVERRKNPFHTRAGYSRRKSVQQKTPSVERWTKRISDNVSSNIRFLFVFHYTSCCCHAILDSGHCAGCKPPLNLKMRKDLEEWEYSSSSLWACGRPDIFSTIT